MGIRKNHVIIAIVVLIIVLIAMAIYANSKKQKEVVELLTKINKEPKGCVEIANLENVQADRFFDAKHYAYVLYSAKGSCWVCNDDEDSVWSVLGNKTLPELSALETSMKNTYGVTIIEHLQSFMGEDEVNRAKTIIDSAPA